MKDHMKLIGIMVVLCVLLLPLGSHSGPLLGNSRTVDIKFTGFCDGLHMVINQNTGLVTGTTTGACVTPEEVVGTVGSLNGSMGGAVTLFNINTTYTPFYAVILDKPQTWIYYYNDGTVLNSGKYTLGVAAAPQAGEAGPSFLP